MIILQQIVICSNYTYITRDFFFPPPETFAKLCTSYDKTYIFIVSFIRCMIYLLILKAYTEIVDTTYYWNNLMFILLSAICIINVLIFLYVTIKKVKISKYSMLPTFSSNDQLSGTRSLFYNEGDNIYIE